MDKEAKLAGALPRLRIAYQVPCHLKDQNIGFPACDILKLIPNTEVYPIERCSAHDGTWGVKKENFADSLRKAKPLFEEIEKQNPDKIVTDCPLAGMQILQGIGRRASHPIEILRDAYR